MQLLKELCNIHAPSGNERSLRNFILSYVKDHMKSWKARPKVISGPEFQDCVLLKFGIPRVMALAHMDSVGFMVRYQDQLVPIGGPAVRNSYKLVGKDALGPIECTLRVNSVNQLHYKFGRGIITGTELTFKPNFRESRNYVQCCFLDNRLGIYNLLSQCSQLENGLLAFTCWEEQGGGSVPMIARFAYQDLGISQALISDITWITDGVRPGKGVAISIRDSNIPRLSYIEKIVRMAKDAAIQHQIEVEGKGSSDGREVQLSPYPIDWAFVGAAEQNVHTPNEKVHKFDIATMISLYRLLFARL